MALSVNLESSRLTLAVRPASSAVNVIQVSGQVSHDAKQKLMPATKERMAFCLHWARPWLLFYRRCCQRRLDIESCGPLHKALTSLRTASIAVSQYYQPPEALRAARWPLMVFNAAFSASQRLKNRFEHAMQRKELA